MPELQQSEYGAEGGDGTELSAEEKRIREEIANKLFTIATQMEVSFKTILGLIDHRHDTWGNDLFFVLTPEQDKEFNTEFGNINRLVGKAETIITDTYLELKAAPSVIDRIKNKFFYLDGIIKRHRMGRFYQYHVKNDKQFIYPFFELDNGIKDLTFILQEVCGMLDGGGEFLRDVIYFLGAGVATGGNSDSGGRSYGYPTSPRRIGYGYDEFGRPISSETEQQPKMRKVGDEADKA